jgi:hypothetical protein
MAVTPARKPKAAELYVCIESYVDAGDPDTPSYARGLRLDGDHPAVQKHLMYWMPASTPDDVIRRAREKLYLDAGADWCPPS